MLQFLDKFSMLLRKKGIYKQVLPALFSAAFKLFRGLNTESLVMRNACDKVM